MTPSNPTAVLAEWAATLRLTNLPPLVRERTKDLFLDAIGCALAADRAEEMAQIDQFAGILGSAPQATVVGRPEQRSEAAAALLNGYRITALTACDVYTPAHFHVTPEVVPAALAMAERSQSSGADMLVALAAGFEVATRVAAGLRYASFRQRGWHMPGVAGPFGAAAAAAHLMALDGLRLRNALGLAGSQAAGTWAAWGTPTVKFHQARGALSGLLAAQLAATGFSAAENVLTNPDGGLLSAYSDGGDPDAIVRDLAERWEMIRISLRPWPGAAPLQPVITGLFRLLEADGGQAWPTARRLRIVVSPSVLAQHARFRHPSGTFEAMLSIHYAAAAIIHFGHLGVDEFLPAAYARPALHDLIDAGIVLAADPELTPLQARLEVTDGARRRTLRVNVPKGHPDDPAPRPLLRAKFRANASQVLDPKRIEELLGRLEGLELEKDVHELCRLVRGVGARRAPCAAGSRARTVRKERHGN